MTLEILWFVIIAFFWSGYFLLEGFDFGVGMLLPFLPRDEEERERLLDSIGPVWDGNEVWLVVAGGATFAAFPAWYASMFSGFYIAFLLLLLLLIVRVVSFEWRSKSDSPRWRRTWMAPRRKVMPEPPGQSFISSATRNLPPSSKRSR
jgi:cytochrome d ubiquinol oxidase subunit II